MFYFVRHRFSDQSKPDSLSENGSIRREGVSVAVHTSDLGTEQLVYSSSGSSAREITYELLTENSELAIELPSNLKFDSGSPNSSVLPCDIIKTDSVLETENTQIPVVQSVTDDSKERHLLFERENFLRRIRWVEQNNEAMRCDWMEQISDTNNLPNFDSSITHGQDPKMVDTGTMCLVSNVLEDVLNEFEKPESSDPIGSCEQCIMDESFTESETSGDLEEKHQIPAALSKTLMEKLVVSDSSNTVDDKRKMFIPSTCKVIHFLCPIILFMLTKHIIYINVEFVLIWSY